MKVNFGVMEGTCWSISIWLVLGVNLAKLLIFFGSIAHLKIGLQMIGKLQDLRQMYHKLENNSIAVRSRGLLGDDGYGRCDEQCP